MFSAILEMLKHPVTTLQNLAEKDDAKKGAIKVAIISGVMSLVGIISKVISINKRYSKNGTYANWYGESGLAEAKSKAFEEAQLFGTFFKTWVVYAVVIAVIALVLFVIAKLVKSDKKYTFTLSMVNNAFIVGFAGYIVDVVISLIYAPLGLLVLYATVTYASYALIFAFKDSLELENSDGLVLATTLVFTVLIIIVYFVVTSILQNAIGSSLSDITSLMK